MALWPLNDSFKSENQYTKVSKNGIIKKSPWNIPISRIETRGNNYHETPLCGSHSFIHPPIHCEQLSPLPDHWHSVVSLMSTKIARHMHSPWVQSLLQVWYCSFSLYITLFKLADMTYWSLRVIRLTTANENLNSKENGKLGYQLEQELIHWVINMEFIWENEPGNSRS